LLEPSFPIVLPEIKSSTKQARRSPKRIPFVPKHAQPRRVTVPALGYKMMSKQSLFQEAKSKCTLKRGLVLRVAFPNDAPTAHLIKGDAQNEKKRLGRLSSSSQRQTEQNRANFNRVVLELNIHQGKETASLEQKQRRKRPKQATKKKPSWSRC
jgi:hypothetical protein